MIGYITSRVLIVIAVLLIAGAIVGMSSKPTLKPFPHADYHTPCAHYEGQGEVYWGCVYEMGQYHSAWPEMASSWEQPPAWQQWFGRNWWLLLVGVGLFYVAAFIPKTIPGQQRRSPSL